MTFPNLLPTTPRTSRLPSLRGMSTGELWAFAAAALTALALMYGAASWQPDWNNYDNAVRKWQLIDLFRDGQWRDLTWSFVTMPEPLVSHTTRTHDVPFWLVAKGLSLFVSDETALSVSFTVVPLLMLCAYLAMGVHLLRRLHGSDDLALNGCLFVLVACFGILNFGPGHVDNHNTQQVLFLACLWQGVRGLDGARGAGAWLAALTLLSLSVSLETLPHLLGIYLFMGIHALTAELGAGTRRAMLEATATLTVLALPLSLFVLGWEMFSLAETDIFSAAYATLLSGSAAGVWLGVVAWQRVDEAAEGRGIPVRFAVRAAAVALPASVGAGLVLLVFPQILSGPYAGMSEIVREQWMDSLLFHKSIVELPRYNIGAVYALIFAVELLIVGAAAVSWKRLDGAGRLVLAVALVSTLATLIEGRNEVFLGISAGLLAPLVVRFARRRELGQLIVGAGCATLFIAAPTIAQMPMWEARSEWLLMPEHECSYYGNRDFADLAPGSVVAPVVLSYALFMHDAIEPNSHTIAHLGAHRTHPGKTRALTGWMADTDDERRAAMQNFDYVALCRETPDRLDTPTRFRGSPLFEQIHGGDVPDWLEPVGREESPLMIFRIAKDAR